MSEPNTSRKRSSRGGGDRGGGRQPENGARASSKAREQVDEAGRKVSAAVKQAGDAASAAAEPAKEVLNKAVELAGGWDELDKTIKSWNRAFYDFSENEMLKRHEATNKPSKLLLVILGLSIFQALIPLFALPLDLFSRLLGFLFLFNTGLAELRAGFRGSSTSDSKVKSLLVAFLLTSTMQLVPAFLLDASYHFGALWGFVFPVLLFTTPSNANPQQTVAAILADTGFALVSDVVDGVMPEGIKGKEQQGTAMMLGVGVVALFWAGYLGALSSYVVVWLFLALSTVHLLGQPYIALTSDTKTAYTDQMTSWHNLLAIWLWRYLVSAIEGISVPGLVSVLGLITYHLPSYFLWVTAFMVGMMATKKTSDGKRATTWYAKWLQDGISSPVHKAATAKA